MQLSGLHMHVDADSNAANLHGTHHHQAENHGHDHSADIDVSLGEKLQANWTQLIPLLLACAILLFAQGWLQQRLWLPAIQLGKLHRHNHWRPPLRAPPTLN